MPKEWKKREMEKSKKETEEPVTVNDQEAALLAAEIGQTPEIDLHGLSVESALRVLEEFLHREAFRGTEAVRVIHGKGKGTLETAVKAWLEIHPEIAVNYRPAQHRVGEVGAVIYVALEDFKPRSR